MGKQTNIKLRGRVENVIYYQWKGIHCMRTVPARVRQTANTKKAASLFGVAVKSAAKIRSLLKPVLPVTTNRSLIYDLDSAFRSWLRDNPLESSAPAETFPAFEAFTFNKEATIGKLFKIVSTSRVNEDDLLIKIPAFNPEQDVTAPQGTRHLGVQFMAVVLPFDEPGHAECVPANMMIPYTDDTLPASEILLAGVTKLHCLVLVVMAMLYYKDDNETLPVNQLRHRPVAVVGSFYN